MSSNCLSISEPTAQKLVLLSLCLLGWFIISPTPVSAGLIDEHSWTTVSDDKKYILVQLLPAERAETFDVEGIELKQKYSVSGVYLNDASNKLLWELPYHPIAYKVYFSPDGNHVFLAQEKTSHTISNIPAGAHLFFHHKNGQSQYRHSCDFSWGWITKHLALRIYDNNYYKWLNTRFYPTQLTYVVKTNQAEEFTFDIRSGNHYSYKVVSGITSQLVSQSSCQPLSGAFTNSALDFLRATAFELQPCFKSRCEISFCYQHSHLCYCF